MSDSDEDSLPNNVFTFQNDNMTISARGPNINNTTGLSFRNNVLTSTMRMPVNFERQRYGSSNFDQRSRRETSPMSLRCIPDNGPSAFNRSGYQNGMDIHRPAYNRRHGSTMSVRSIDSTASVSAAEIVFAFKNVKFNKYDLRIIKDAYNKLIKTRQRKRIEKRRNLKLFLKGTRRKSGEDSGDQGSDSSMSSDDCRSVRTTICKENIPGLRLMSDAHFSTNMRGCTNYMPDGSHFSNKVKEMPMFTDCSEIIKQNTLRKMMSVSNDASKFSTNHRFINTVKSQDQNQTSEKGQNTSVMTQKERFKKGFLLPSQRFNKTIAGQTQVNNNDKLKRLGKNRANLTKQSVPESDSDQEEIFKGFSVNEKDTQNIQRKRSLDTEDSCYSNKKRNKSDSRKMQSSEPSETIQSDIPNGKSDDFIFAKPKMLIKKSNKKDCIPEKLLAKSHMPPIVEKIDFNFAQSNINPLEKENDKGVEALSQSDTLHPSSDVTMRPSFIKRKLFTQKLDVAERKNASSDSLGVNSPQNIYSASVREKSKARKLVTSQSCLSRDIPGEDNNVLDLIHKIIPPDQINVTNITNKTESCNNGSINDNKSDKWDVTAVIANCDNQDISDTYTDEEIFNVNQVKDSANQSEKSTHCLKKQSQCKVVLEKLQPEKLNKVMENNNNNKVQIKSGTKSKTNKKSVTDCVKAFWDTDFESDMEFNVAPSWKTSVHKNQETLLQKRSNNIIDKKSQDNKKASKSTILTVRNCPKDSMLNNSLKSHRNLISCDKKGGNLKPVSVANVSKSDKEISSTSRRQRGMKEDTVKENVPVNNTKEAGRKLKAKQCVDCVEDKPIKVSKNSNKSKKLTENKDSLDNKNSLSKNSLNGNLFKTTLKSKDCKKTDPEQSNRDTMKITKSDQKNNVKNQKEPMGSRRMLPKRKSEDKSFSQSSELITITSNTKTLNKTPKTKSAKELVYNNTSVDSISTIITRSRSKQSCNSSQDDCSSMNLSNISNRSLRLIQRNKLK